MFQIQQRNPGGGGGGVLPGILGGGGVLPGILGGGVPPRFSNHDPIKLIPVFKPDNYASVPNGS